MGSINVGCDQRRRRYPIEEMLDGRRFFEDVMGRYRYLKSNVAGGNWGHTGDIAHNFKAVDFYHDFTVVGNNILAKTAVSMKTTVSTNVETWLVANKKHIDDLLIGKGSNSGILWSGKKIFYENAELHIYLKQPNVTGELTTTWINKLSAEYPTIKFEIRSIENFIN